LRGRRPVWQPKGGQRILVVAPHPDDEALGCGGTMMQHVAIGDSVHVLTVTDGGRSRAGHLSRDIMVQTRRSEAQAASDFIGVRNLHWLGLPEGEWDDDQLIPELLKHIEDISPDIIYAPTILDYHPEHRRVGHCLAAVVLTDAVIRIYTLHIPLSHLANIRVDVSREISAVGELFAIYQTQVSSLLRGLRLRRYAAALNDCGMAMEEFWELSGAAYKRSHLDINAPIRVRGLRYWSFTDPLSYMIGWKARRAIADRSVGE
jgi:LmbE family N-acetylglucosaminyl deacetylase